jgi:hypothetical protein
MEPTVCFGNWAASASAASREPPGEIRWKTRAWFSGRSCPWALEAFMTADSMKRYGMNSSSPRLAPRRSRHPQPQSCTMIRIRTSIVRIRTYRRGWSKMDEEYWFARSRVTTKVADLLESLGPRGVGRAVPVPWMA